MNTITNITAYLFLVLSTNWTSHSTLSGNQLGYVVTNYTAQVVFENTTNNFILKTAESNVAVWRPYQYSGAGITNLWGNLYVITNR